MNWLLVVGIVYLIIGFLFFTITWLNADAESRRQLIEAGGGVIITGLVLTVLLWPRYALMTNWKG